MCDQPATGVEHAPPRCFFPASKDLPKGVDLRRGLITVPSCDLHNGMKSTNDEYLAFVVLTHFENNDVAARQVMTKVLRALQKRPSLRGFFAVNRPVNLNGVKTLAYKVDTARFEIGMEQMARALYFNSFSDKWLAPIAIHSPALFQFDSPTAVSLHESKQNLASMMAEFLGAQPRIGENPDVFWYQIHRDPAEAFLMINMVFYGGLNVLALSHPNINMTKGEPSGV